MHRASHRISGRRFSAILAAGVALLSATCGWAQNGIFADFTTSLGSFTCVLDYTNAPKAVANFIGLATGGRPWLNMPTGTARTNAFFDGLTFHRVIAGFMIQSGSPNAQGTDGPGYAFPDEFKPVLRFNGAGVLAMANSGPKSNGSQYFVTVAPTPWLNDVHTIFGWVVSGTNVITAISQVVTDVEKPLTNVVVQRVAIRRVGTAAQAFDINAQALPIVRNVGLKATNAAGQVAITFSNRPYADNRLYSSTNLASWSATSLGIEGAGAGTNTLYASPGSPAGFYQFAQVQYASSTFAPKALRNRTLTLSISGGGVLRIVFDGSGGGTYTYPPNAPGILTGYDWFQEPYRGYLWPVYFSAWYPMTMRLDFNSDSAGNFSGTQYMAPTYPNAPISGTFTLSP